MPKINEKMSKKSKKCPISLFFSKSTCHYLDSRGASGDERFGGAGTGAREWRVCGCKGGDGSRKWFHGLWGADCE